MQYGADAISSGSVFAVTYKDFFENNKEIAVFAEQMSQIAGLKIGVSMSSGLVYFVDEDRDETSSVDVHFAAVEVMDGNH